MTHTDKLKLYTNHRCPWAHRAHIALNELGLPFEEEIIDLDTPRTKEYLAVNPRGLVPSLNFNGEIITESAIVATFLADQYPSHLVPPSAEGALKRARIAFFVDTFTNKIIANFFKLLFGGENDELAAATIKGAEELDGLLPEKGFFDGGDKLTLAEVLTGPFAIRLLALSRGGLLPKSLVSSIQERAPKFYGWAERVSAHPSVKKQFNEEEVVATTKAKLEQRKAEAAKI